jgi:hypothetical protein
VLRGHSDEVTTCAVSPDGSFIVSASNDGTLRVWEAGSGRVRHVLAGHSGAVWSCAVSPDGSCIISTGEDGLLVWEADSGAELANIPLHGSAGRVAAAHAQPLVVCGGLGGRVHLLDLVAIEYGPIVVTAVDHGAGLKIRCPACLKCLRVEKDRLGQEIFCPERACGCRMRINEFVVGRIAAPAPQTRRYSTTSSTGPSSIKW